jgi:hypothetical protein
MPGARGTAAVFVVTDEPYRDSLTARVACPRVNWMSIHETCWTWHKAYVVESGGNRMRRDELEIVDFARSRCRSPFAVLDIARTGVLDRQPSEKRLVHALETELTVQAIQLLLR